MIRFTDRLKGDLTQSIFNSLMLEVGLISIPVGIEQVIREVTSLSYDQYSKLALPTNLRSLPDFLVSDRDFTYHKFVEIKYRSTWNAKTRLQLKTKIEAELATWSPLYLVVFLGSPAEDRGYTEVFETPATWLRAAKLGIRDGLIYADVDDGNILWGDLTWKLMCPLQRYFPELKKTFEEEESAMMIASRVGSSLGKMTKNTKEG